MQSAVALGNFDGVHKAHAALIEKTVQEAKKRSLRATAYILDPHPRTLLHPEEPVRLLTSIERKTELLHELGIDSVYTERRGKEILQLTPPAFVEKILKEELAAKFVVVGFNYRFGKNAAGDAEEMKRLCRENKIDCTIMNPVMESGKPVSSTRLRAMLAMGDTETVNRLSFRPYTLDGVVQKGKQLGVTLGFPTMNIAIERDMLVPRHGVYISRTYIDGIAYGSVTNIGVNPTVENTSVRMESHLLAYKGDAYGKKVSVEFLAFIRDEKAFPSLEALCMQIEKDKQAAITYFEGMI